MDAECENVEKFNMLASGQRHCLEKRYLKLRWVTDGERERERATSKVKIWCRWREGGIDRSVI